MKIGLIDLDNTKFPNLALMKISSYHKRNGDNVEWYLPFEHYDKVYVSKVFNFTPDYEYFINADEIVKGGTGYDISKVLPEEIDKTCPDYSLYPYVDKKTAYGFLTRGCPNKCKWCVVPKKEGKIKPYMDVEEIAIDGRTNLILMDNNVLASDFGIKQIVKIIEKGYKIDFNQAMDARLVTDDIAYLIANVKWLNYVRFGCDSHKQIEDCINAINLLRKYGYKKEFMLYTMLHGDIKECYDRITYWKRYAGLVCCNAQPYRDPINPRAIIPQWQKDMARWTNRKELYKSFDFKEYEPRVGFKCNEYFKTE